MTRFISHFFDFLKTYEKSCILYLLTSFQITDYLLFALNYVPDINHMLINVSFVQGNAVKSRSFGDVSRSEKSAPELTKKKKHATKIVKQCVTCSI